MFSSRAAPGVNALQIKGLVSWCLGKESEERPLLPNLSHSPGCFCPVKQQQLKFSWFAFWQHQEISDQVSVVGWVQDLFQEQLSCLYSRRGSSLVEGSVSSCCGHENTPPLHLSEPYRCENENLAPKGQGERKENFNLPTQLLLD